MVFILYNVKCQELTYWLLASYAVYKSAEITYYSFQGGEQIFVHKDNQAKFQELLTNATNDTKEYSVSSRTTASSIIKTVIEHGGGNRIVACNRYHKLI